MTADSRAEFEAHWHTVRGAKQASRELRRREDEPQSYVQDSANRHWITWQASRKGMSEPSMEAVAEVLSDQDAEDWTLAKVRWLYNPVPVGTQLFWNKLS